MNLYQNIINRLTNPAPPLVITATLRQARHIREHYLQAVVAANSAPQKSIATPQIHALNAWLTLQWEELQQLGLALPLVLNSWQVSQLWREVVNDSSYAAEILSGGELAKTAYQAWQLLEQWQLTTVDFIEPHTLETTAFIDLSNDFVARLASRNAIDAIQLPALLARELNALALPKQIIIYGFDDLPPAITMLLTALTDAGCTVEHLNDTISSQAAVLAVADSNAEWLFAANYAQAALLNEPTSTIGIVIPELATNRAEIDRIFREVLAPEQLFDDAAAALPYTLSSGIPLASVAVCDVALLTLRGVWQELTQEEWSRWLLSPYLQGFADEQAARAKFDAWLRDLNLGIVKLAALSPLLAAAPFVSTLPLLQQILDSFSRLDEANFPTTCHDGLNTFSQVLAYAGWPGDLEIDSHDYQAIAQWHGVMNEVASLDILLSNVSVNHVLNLLQERAQAKLFQIEAADQPIQVLGQLEAAGLLFDTLLVTGLTDDVWPAKPQPNPLLPLSVQRKHHMPHASSERELAFAKALTARYLQSAAKVVFSYPREVEGMEKMPSPLIPVLGSPSQGNLPPLMSEQLQGNLLPLMSEQLQGNLPPFLKGGELPQAARGDFLDSCVMLENLPGQTSFVFPPLKRGGTDMTTDVPSLTMAVIDATGLPITEPKIKSGASVFSNMAACHFKAYAKGRLNAYTFPKAWQGLSQRQRGTLMHRVYQLFWQDVKSHQALQQLNATSLLQKITTAVAQGIMDFQARQLISLPESLLELEEQRLQHSLQDWLQHELPREPFQVIACEHKIDASIAGYNFTLRLDRLDRLSDGHYVIIDYKIGNQSLSAWQGDRPNDLQLPLYSLLLGEEVAAIAFATLVPRDKKFLGLAIADELLPGVKTPDKTRGFNKEQTWESIHQQWQAISERLITSYAQGAAERNPKQLLQTCRLCDLAGLCRFQAHGVLNPNDVN